MASKRRTNTTATARLKQDFMRIVKDPVPYIVAAPLASNILEWHYIVLGPAESPYEGGYYHGKLIFPREYPFKPPSIYMITPNGRFKCNTRLCLSISDFHPDTWNPAWSVSTILTGLLSFMLEKSPTLGSIETSDYTKRSLAAQSLAFNLKDKVFTETFPEITKEIEEKLQQQQEELARSTQNTTGPTSQTSPHPGLRRTPGTGHAMNANGQEQGFLNGALANIAVIIGFAAFAYTVKYVLKSIVE
ncbi:ubiquitin-conjugating enzyme E2 J2 [Lingula anatina]|uniref:Ubiquitin-conjugating enzyme E2 J2 n=1 Tax=Lingula anatina TaxID=7574 RepID=A0A1S3I7Z9_LINAN|nr:ubiquitin-conjugating enzyme E2 J2 [Lingula anatina]|eukprot:XP_013393986.1 ubiquitin-conjugating enzyme E2 J2 [Lingula anatina]